MTKIVKLTEKRADILWSYRHPWVFSQGIATTIGKPYTGDIVEVKSLSDRHLGFAFYHASNNIALRMISFSQQPMTEQAWISRLEKTLEWRKSLGLDFDCLRLIHGENDGFPGLTIDKFGKLLVAQVTSAGMDNIKKMICEQLMKLTGATAVYEKSNTHARKLEGLPLINKFMLGHIQLPVHYKENGFEFTTDPRVGQKTGWYCDQREQRKFVETISKGKRVLDLCCFSGGFTMPAIRGGATHVMAIDQSSEAIDQLHHNFKANNLSGLNLVARTADVFEFLKPMPRTTYDLVIMDPPALCKKRIQSKDALKAYRNLQAMAAKWVSPGGMLMTFSCTGVVQRDEFKQSVFLGLGDAKRIGMIAHEFHAGADHPVNVRFPEGDYLKGFGLVLP